MARTVTAESPMTAKQTKFAAKVADGATKAAAYRQNYRDRRALGIPKLNQTDRRTAHELSQKPHVAAEIRRLTWLSCPNLDDTRGMREHAVRIIADLSRTAKNEGVRLQAAMALYRIAETTAAADAARSGPPPEQDRLLSALRGLYKQLEGMAGNPTVEDARAHRGEPLLPVVEVDVDYTSAETTPAADISVPEPEPAEPPAGG